MLLRGLLLASLIALPTAASAQSVKSLLQDYGLLGTWSADCAQSADLGNPRARYSVSPSGDGLLFSRTGTARTDTIYVIYGAERLPDGKLLLHEQREEDGAMFDVVLEKQQGKLQVWSTRPHELDMPVLVAGGKLETPLARCDAKTPDSSRIVPRITPASH